MQTNFKKLIKLLDSYRNMSNLNNSACSGDLI